MDHAKFFARLRRIRDKHPGRKARETKYKLPIPKVPHGPVRESWPPPTFGT